MLTATDSVPLVPLFAALSAFSLPDRFTCAATHWKRTSVPRVVSWCVVITISLTRSSRALAESDPMEEIAALESLEMTIADGGV